MYDCWVVRRVGNGYSVFNTYTNMHHSWYEKEKEANKVAARFNELASIITSIGKR